MTASAVHQGGEPEARTTSGAVRGRAEGAVTTYPDEASRRLWAKHRPLPLPLSSH